MLHSVKLVALVVVLVGLVSAPTAGAVTLVTPDGQVAQPYQRWADAAKVPTYSGPVELSLAMCPYIDNGASCSFGYDSPPRVWLAATHTPPDEQATRLHDLELHELGHVFDAQVMTGAARERFAAIFGLRGQGWTEGPYRLRLEEQFAQGYMLCAYDPRQPFSATSIGYAPSIRQHRRVCALIRRAGGWYMTPAT